MTPEAGAVLLAAGTSAAVGAVAAPAVWLISRRSLRAAAFASPIVVAGSIAAGVLVASKQMLLSQHDSQLILYVVAAATLVAVGYGLIVGARLQESQRAAAEATAARERDAEVEARRRELVAWASHDLRTPIGGIRVMAEALDDGLGQPDYPRRIAAQADRLGDMVDNLLALSRLNSGTWTPQVERVNLADLASDALAAARPGAEKAGVRLTGSAPAVVEVDADARDLARVLDNLIGNAVRHTPAGGEVSVAVTGEPERVVVVVRDACGGLPEGSLDRLFEPWWRGTDARTPGGGAAGLGLAVVAGIVAAHGGSVSASNAPGGCAFRVELPRRAPEVTLS